MTEQKPKKMIVDIDTARMFAKILGDRIYDDIIITKREVKEKDGRQNDQ